MKPIEDDSSKDVHRIGMNYAVPVQDREMFNETVSRPKAEPVDHDDPITVTGHHLGDRNRASKGRKK